MSIKLNISSKHWIVISILLLGLSSIQIKKLTEEHGRVKTQLNAARQALAKENKNLSQIREGLEKSTTTAVVPPRAIVPYFNEFNYAIREAAPKYRLNIASVRFATNTSGMTMDKDINSVAGSFAQAPTLKYTTVIITGQYQDVDSLQQFIDSIRAQNVAISKVDIRETSFTIAADLYGN